jgi:4-phospho-D-threonate 3-dehydrogenase / 4-phospho-D-erythronate 3-dehydrogenase
MHKPKIGVPIGDPAGIGPEIALKACLFDEVLSSSIPILIGDVSVLSEND